jgi:transposase
MMGRQDRDQRQLFYEFSLDEMIPKDHLLRRINVFATAVLADLHEQLKTFYSDIGRPSVDPENIFVVQSAEDWAAKNAPCPLHGAR